MNAYLPTVIFDGACPLCSRSARLIRRLDTHKRFRLLPALSEEGTRILDHLGMNAMRLESVVLLQDGAVDTHSLAVLKIAKGLGWPWRAAYALVALPPGIRDAAYRWVARNRYRITGVRV